MAKTFLITLHAMTLNQIISVLGISTTAKQYLLYECKGSVLRTDLGGGAYGWWTDRNDNKMVYWPNGNSNCDINDGIWREDGGWITAKSELPIRNLRFGDTGDGTEEGYHTVGKVWAR